MHDRTGRPVQNGDTLFQVGNEGKITFVGQLQNAVAGNEYCNGDLICGAAKTGACLCDTLHIDSLADILKEKGLDKRPAGM